MTLDDKIMMVRKIIGDPVVNPNNDGIRFTREWVVEALTFADAKHVEEAARFLSIQIYGYRYEWRPSLWGRILSFFRRNKTIKVTTFGN